MTEPASPVLFAGRQFPPDTEVIDLVNIRLVTLEPLGSLHELRVLRLHHTNPHQSPGGALLDLSVLGKCPHLTVIEVPQQSVQTLDGLEGHPNLHTIDISATRVFDLAPLAGLPGLTTLRLRHTRVADITPLASVLSLAELDIAHTPVADISPLRGLPRLVSLDLRATPVTDLSPLMDMAALQQVVVQRLAVDTEVIDRLRESRPELEVIV
nr:leucine-rich repeat domain-containing protein [uncultured Desulfobacter sp.]